MKNEKKFVGRVKEREILSTALRKKIASLVVIKGRRRVGKSRLISEFAKGYSCYKFTGLAPGKDTDAQSQRDHFALLLSRQTGLPEMKLDNWSKLFSLLFDKVRAGRVIILFDELTWMAMGDGTFLSKLQAAWEDEFKTNPELILILCGSVSWWIEKNLLSSTGYFGRVSITLTVDELPLNICGKLMDEVGFKGSSYERLVLLGIMGGIPWYIEQLDPGLSALENIRRLCFRKNGLLVGEFTRIFHDLFGKSRYEIHAKIVKSLAEGPAEYDKIAKDIGYSSSGALSEYLGELEISDFIQRDYTWKLGTGDTSKLSRYRLRDNYLRFYIKYIMPKLSQISRDQYSDVSILSLSGWDTTMGLQMENLVLNNRKLIHEALSINPNDIIQDNPFFQRATKLIKGCQIDYLIQTRLKALYVCEIKFSRNEIGMEVVKQVKEKIKNMKLPRGLACLPVLIVASDVKQSVLDLDYFVRVIDLRDMV